MKRRLVVALVVALVVLAGPAAAGPLVHERIVLGESVRGRAIAVVHEGDVEAPRILVVGCVHGDECAGVAIADRLLELGPRHSADLWVVRSFNPDGRAARTRQNARGVDLNRNFPYRWEPGLPGRYYPGPRPLSEPESRIAARLVERLEPALTIWFHQPLGLVDLSGGGERVVRRYARLVGLPAIRLPRLHGTATSWQSHELPGSTAFVVELPGGPLSARRARVFGRAVFALAGTLPRALAPVTPHRAQR